MTLGVRGLVVDQDGKVLLIKHTYVPGWYFPGGGVEKGEPCEEALSRELVEEAGVRIEQPPRLVGVFSNHASFPNDHVLLYEIKEWSEVEATSRGEIADIGFFDPEVLPEDVNAGTKKRIEEYVAGRKPDIFWSAPDDKATL